MTVAEQELQAIGTQQARARAAERAQQREAAEIARREAEAAALHEAESTPFGRDAGQGYGSALPTWTNEAEVGSSSSAGDDEGTRASVDASADASSYAARAIVSARSFLSQRSAAAEPRKAAAAPAGRTRERDRAWLRASESTASHASSESESESTGSASDEFPDTPVKRTPASVPRTVMTEQRQRRYDPPRSVLAARQVQVRGNAVRVPLGKQTSKASAKKTGGRKQPKTAKVSPSPARVALHETAKALSRIYELHRQAKGAVAEEEKLLPKSRSKKKSLKLKAKRVSARRRR